MDEGDRRRLLEVLDDTPATVTGLSRKLGWEEERVKEGLARLEDDKLAIDWGQLWATTWRAKLELEPRFFRIWIPVSAALGAATVAVALLFNAGPSVPGWLAPAFALTSLMALAYGLDPVFGEDEPV